MATREEIEFVWERLRGMNTARFFKMIGDGNAGVGAVLKLLYEADEPMTASAISEYMHVSSARVAVLLRKMDEQGLITRADDKNDARVIMISLSGDGRQKAVMIESRIFGEIAAVVDRVGMARLSEFIAISDEIRSVLSECTEDIIPAPAELRKESDLK